ncbi:MAG: hypothetical protein FJ295_07270 [Planctomycetes bacterium]|nr:hypothetical protein [Planctomycetota bacterium]
MRARITLQLQILIGFGFVIGFLRPLAAQPQSAEEEPIPKIAVLRAVADSESNAIVIADGGDGAGLQFTFSTPIGAGPMFFGGGAGGLPPVPADELGMLAMDQFQSELELVDRQKEQIAQLRQDLNERRRKVMGDMKNIEPRKVASQFRELESTLQLETKTRLAEILLPHQVDRLKQLRVQMQVRNRGLSALTGPDLSDALGLSDDQKSKLAEKQAEAQKQLREKIEELRKQLQQEVIQEVLTPVQRDKLSKLTGSEFKLKPVEAPAARSAPDNVRTIKRAQ